VTTSTKIDIACLNHPASGRARHQPASSSASIWSKDLGSLSRQDPDAEAPPSADLALQHQGASLRSISGACPARLRPRAARPPDRRTEVMSFRTQGGESVAADEG
jgi:hypothetical protein